MNNEPNDDQLNTLMSNIDSKLQELDLQLPDVTEDITQLNRLLSIRKNLSLQIETVRNRQNTLALLKKLQTADIAYFKKLLQDHPYRCLCELLSIIVTIQADVNYSSVVLNTEQADIILISASKKVLNTCAFETYMADANFRQYLAGKLMVVPSVEKVKYLYEKLKNYVSVNSNPDQLNSLVDLYEFWSECFNSQQCTELYSIIHDLALKIFESDVKKLVEAIKYVNYKVESSLILYLTGQQEISVSHFSDLKSLFLKFGFFSDLVETLKETVNQVQNEHYHRIEETANVLKIVHQKNDVVLPASDLINHEKMILCDIFESNDRN